MTDFQVGVAVFLGILLNLIFWAMALWAWIVTWGGISLLVLLGAGSAYIFWLWRNLFKGKHTNS